MSRSQTCLPDSGADRSDSENGSALLFICPHCRHRSREFFSICPECGRPLMRDYIDWQMHPRDPELRGTLYYSTFWARVWLLLALLGLLFSVLFNLTWKVP